MASLIPVLLKKVDTDFTISQILSLAAQVKDYEVRSGNVMSTGNILTSEYFEYSETNRAYILKPKDDNWDSDQTICFERDLFELITKHLMSDYQILTTKPAADYELLDSGDNEKLERYGKIIVRRPDPQALWPKALASKEWQKATAKFMHDSDAESGWETSKQLPKDWTIKLGNLKFKIFLGSFKHTGVFPEHLSNWQWLEHHIKASKREISVLNLFGYTGGASLACASAGASVCHLDGSKVAVNGARNNAELSGLSKAKIRWIVDDVVTFVKTRN